MTAAETPIICTNATVPSCIRVPPEAGAASSGSPSAVARSTAVTSRRAVATPIEPPRKPNSDTSSATRCPSTQASPVSTASSAPLDSAAARSSAAYGGSTAPCSGGVSQETNEPASTVRARNSRALGRSTRRA